MGKNLLIIFIKNPEPGKVKTRLAATIGETEALNIYKQLLTHTRKITIGQKIDKVVFYSDFVDYSDEWTNSVFQKHRQEGSELGERMLNAFKWAFNSGYDSVCIIGSDCFELTPKILKDAFAKLKTNELVIGPSVDGGYYLLGMNKLYDFLFKNKHWSTGSVFQETIKDVEEYNISASLLAVLRDVDVESDLKLMPAFAKQ